MRPVTHFCQLRLNFHDDQKQNTRKRNQTFMLLYQELTSIFRINFLRSSFQWNHMTFTGTNISTGVVV